jgi:hypothetical protein
LQNLRATFFGLLESLTSRGLVKVLTENRKQKTENRKQKTENTTPLLHYSITPLLHYSTTPLLHYSSSTTPIPALLPQPFRDGRQKKKNVRDQTDERWVQSATQGVEQKDGA